jgi:hypothetical protein
LEHAVDVAYLSATAALSGSAIGGLTSFLASWVSQNAQTRAQLLASDRLRRQEFYRAFTEDASSLYIDGLTRDTPDLSKTIGLYALISRMRVLSSPRVIEEAEKVALQIVESYPKPNRTFGDLREMIHEHALDPLRGFSEACREEFRMAAIP